jgi:hypothetical protein
MSKTLPHVHDILDLLCPMPMAYRDPVAMQAGAVFHEQMASWLKQWREYGDPSTLPADAPPAMVKAAYWLNKTIRGPIWIEDVLTAPEGYLATPDLIGISKRGGRIILVDWKHTLANNLRYYVQVEAYAALPEVGPDAQRFLVFVTDEKCRAVPCPKNPMHRVAFLCALRVWQWRQTYA